MTVQHFSYVAPAEVEAPTLPMTDVTPLGVAGGRSFAKLRDGSEITIGAVLGSYELANLPNKDELRLTRRVPSGRPVGPTHVMQTIRAQRVEPGSYAAAVAKDETTARYRKRMANPPRQRVDALAYLPLMRHDPGSFMTLAPRDADNYLSPGRVIGTPGAPAARGPAAIIARLAAKGVTVEVDKSGQYLQAWAKRGRLKPDVRELLAIAEPLLRGFLAGESLPCALDHKRGEAPAAVTLVEPSGMPVCEQHADEERS